MGKQAETVETNTKETADVSDVDTSYMREGNNIVFLLPSDLYSEPSLNVRPFEGESDEWQRQNQKKLNDLAASVGERQLDTVLIGPANENGKHPIIAGNRRVKSIALDNEKRSQAGKPLGRVRCQIISGGDLFSMALDSNIQRDGMGPVSKAMLIVELQKRYPELYGEQAGVKGQKALARKLGFVGENPLASLIQYRKLLKAPSEVKEQVELGLMTMAGALALIDAGVDPKRVGKVIEAAREEQLGKALEKAGKQVQRVEEKVEQAVEAAGGKAVDRARGEKKLGQAREKAVEEVEKATRRVDTQELKKAIAKEQAATGKEPKKALARSRGEILQFFAQQDGPVNGETKSAPRTFCRYLFETWAAGLGGEAADGKLQKLWYAATEKAVGKLVVEKAVAEKTVAGVKSEKPQAASKAVGKVVGKKPAKAVAKPVVKAKTKKR